MPLLNPSTRQATRAILMGLCLTLAGCGTRNPVTKVNFVKLKVGMTRAEVDQVMGKPSKENPFDMFAKGAIYLEWGDDNKHIGVVVSPDNKVSMLLKKGID
jgi:hypothetical protein